MKAKQELDNQFLDVQRRLCKVWKFLCSALWYFRYYLGLWPTVRFEERNKNEQSREKKQREKFFFLFPFTTYCFIVKHVPC